MHEYRFRLFSEYVFEICPMKTGGALTTEDPPEDAFARMILCFFENHGKKKRFCFRINLKKSHPLLVVRFPAVDPAGPIDLFQDQETGYRVSKGHL